MKYRTILLWFLALVITFGIASYQKRTGPSWPVEGEALLNNNKFDYSLERTHGGMTDHEIRIRVPDPAITGWVIWKRYKVNEPVVSMPLLIDGMELVGRLPFQPPAGKLEYQVKLVSSGDSVIIPPDEPAVIRFKGEVSLWVLLPHIVLLFLALFIGMQACLSAIFGLSVKKKAWAVFWLIVVGGLVLGPIVQKQAFGAFWTGWPFGGDWTDNKTAVMFLGWLAAIWMLRGEQGEKRGRWWVVAATVLMFAVYLIPHSMRGSELDYSSLPSGTTFEAPQPVAIEPVEIDTLEPPFPVVDPDLIK